MNMFCALVYLYVLIFGTPFLCNPNHQPLKISDRQNMKIFLNSLESLNCKLFDKDMTNCRSDITD